MALGPSIPGLNNVPSYQISGVPWVTGSLAVTGVMGVAFPAVTRFFTVKNTGGSAIKLGFTAEGVAAQNFFTIASNETQSFELRVRSIFLSGSGGTADVVGGLTSIPISQYAPLTRTSPAPTGSQYLPGV